MGLFDQAENLLPGLKPAAWRGLAFDMPDVSTEVGRRLVEHLFPGVDPAAYDDHGVLPDIISIDGVIVGDDYIAQARAFEAAFKQPGPGTLMHAWHGPMTVLLAEPATITLSTSHLRVAYFQATFKRVNALAGFGASGLISTAQQLITAANQVISTVVSMVSSVRTVSLSSQRYRAINRTVRKISVATVDLPVPFVAPFSGSTPDVDDLGGALQSVVDDYVDLIVPPPAVAPSAEAPEPDALDALDLFGSMLGATELILLEINRAPSPTDQALLFASSAALVAATAHVSIWNDYTSRSEATAARLEANFVFNQLAKTSELLSDTRYQALASSIGGNLASLSHALQVDINEAIGRLPAVLVLETNQPQDAFTLAHYFKGDDPAAVEAVYRDIVARNRPRHPAQVPAGRIEAIA